MVEYSVILLRPFRNEVLDTVVSMASDSNGFFATVGPLQIFVSRMNVHNIDRSDMWAILWFYCKPAMSCIQQVQEEL